MFMVGQQRVAKGTKAPRRCKACQSCRERKIKCDGRQPSCGSCLQQGQSCKYSDDKRQTSRVTKDVVNSMSSKLAALEHLVKRLENSGQPQGLANQAPAPADTLSPTLHVSSDQIDEPGNSSLSSSAPLPTSLVDPGADDRLPSNAIDDLEGLNNAVEVGSVPSLSDQIHQPERGSRSPCQDEDDIAVSGLHMRVSNSVHGLTSAFHPQSFSPSTGRKTVTSESPAQSMSDSRLSDRPQQYKETEEQLRARLFMYAALEKQKEHTFRSQRKYDLDGLDYDTGLHLLELHWNHQHCAYLLTYRPAIMNSLATNGPYASKLLLNALYYSSSLNSDREGRHDAVDGQAAGHKFFVRFNELLLPELERSSICNAIALLQMGSSLFANGRQTLGWLYSGLGYRMIIDLGLHVDLGKIQTSKINHTASDSDMSFIDVELQRRAYWGAYVNDKFQSLFFGRPPALPATGIEPPQTLLDTYEEMELWSPYIDPQNVQPLLCSFSPKPTYAVSTFTWLIKLAEISSEIIEHFYMPAIYKLKKPIVMEYLTKLQNELDRWHEKLPSHLRFEPGKDPAPPAHQFNLHTTYNTLCILLHRPFLPEGHLKHFCLDERSTRETCISAALKIYQLGKAYRDTFTLRRAPYLFSYALFSAATVIPHHQTPGWSHHAETGIAIFFWNALAELQKGSNFGLRRPIRIIRDFMERAGVDINALAMSSDNSAPRSPLPSHVAFNGGQITDPAQLTTTTALTVDGNILNLPDMYMDNFDWLDCSINPSYDESEDILYGLFRSS